MADSEEGVASPQLASVRFLPDVATDQDFFGSHQRVADSIAAALIDNARLKVVGILGPWGSGKSTVVKLVEQALGRSQFTHLLFTYDAWLHQSDPPRRAFLERFLDFLVTHKLVDAGAWREPMDKLNRRIEDSETTTTPRLTRAGHLLLLSLAAVPFGTRFLGADWYKKMTETSIWSLDHWVFPIGLLLAGAPLILTLLLYYSWRPVRHPFSRAYFRAANWTRHRHPHEKSSVLALIVNKQVATQHSRVIKTPEPTTIEFQSIFRDMLRAGYREQQRIVLVIDNLDRLPEADAIAMWTTIRSLFLGALWPSELPAETAMPSVLLPIDEHAVARLYQTTSDTTVDKAAPSLAQSFMDKTFDLTFHVARPVLSDWNAYLKTLLVQAFGEALAEEWAFDVGRIYATSGRTRVTPRDLNRLVNAIAALWLQWREQRLPFPTVAYYAIFRDELDRDLGAMLANPKTDLSEHDADWAASLAAIHFAVPPHHALQIMLEPELLDAIEKSDTAKFASQCAIRGAGRVLVGLIDDARLELAGMSNLAELLTSENAPDFEESEHVWRKLRRAYLASDMLTGLDDRAGRLPAILFTQSGGPVREKVLQEIANRLEAFSGTDRYLAGVRAGFSPLLEAWHTQAAQSENPPKVNLGDPTLYLETVAPLDAGRQSALILSRTSADGLARDLANRLNLGDFKNGIAQTELVFAHGPGKTGFKLLLNAAGNQFSDGDATSGAFEASVHILGRLRPIYPPAAERLKELAQNGELAERFVAALESLFNGASARLAALLILELQPVPRPGEREWPAYLKESKRFADRVDEALVAYAGGRFLSAVAHQQHINGDVRTLLTAIMKRRTDARGLGEFVTEDVLRDSDPYWLTLLSSTEADFYALILADNAAWELLAAQKLDTASRRIYSPLIAMSADNPTRRKARSALRKALKEVDQQRWAETLDVGLEDDKNILTLALHLAAKDPKPLALGSPLFDALQARLATLGDDGNAKLVATWFRAASLLSESARRTLLSNMRDRLNLQSDLSNLVMLLNAGGKQLLQDGDFTARADESVRHILMPLVEDDDGLLWMDSQHDILADWIQQAGTAAREFLAERMRDHASSAGETSQALIHKLLHAWNLE